MTASALLQDPRKSRVERCLKSAMTFAESLGLETYDPFDTKGSKLVVWTFQRRGPFRKFVRNVVYGCELFAPFALRRWMKIPKRATAGGTSRLAQAHMAAYKLDGDPTSLQKAACLLQWLLDHPGVAPHGLGWGVPFEWSTFFGDVPANTAVSHTTQACGHAFLDYHDLTGQSWAIEAAHRCCEFLTMSLRQTTHASGSISLGYTPMDESEVVNISAEAAGFLLRAGRPVDQKLVWKLGQFVVECQSADGSFPYSAPASVEGANPIDHYHTGMVLSGLHTLASDSTIRAAFEKGLDFHLNRHFDSDGCPKMRPTSRFPIDSYSAGESLITLSALRNSPFLSDSLKSRVSMTLDPLVDFVLSEMSYPDGGFVYRAYPRRKLRIDSLRWAQALICHGLASYLLPPNEVGAAGS